MYLEAYANHLLGVQVMATISLQCNNLSQIHSSVLAANSMTDRACIGEVMSLMTQVWVKSFKK